MRPPDDVAALPLDRLDRKVTASVGDKAKAGIGEESPTSGNAATRGCFRSSINPAADPGVLTSPYRAEERRDAVTLARCSALAEDGRRRSFVTIFGAESYSG